MSTLFLLLLLTTTSLSKDDASNNNDNIDDEAFNEGASAIPANTPATDGRSFFFLGTIFRRFRDRWLAYHNSAPLYAGPAYPINGYYNCPLYGCNPALIGPQPPPPRPPQSYGGAYPPNYYYNNYYPPIGGGSSIQQQEPQSPAQSSNVYIYQNEQNTGFYPTQQALSPTQQALGPTQQGFSPTQQSFAPTQQALGPMPLPMGPPPNIQNSIQGYRPTFLGGPVTPIFGSATSSASAGGNNCGPVTYPCNFG